MNSNQRLQLNQIIDENNVEDCTAHIREKQHSGKIREAVTKMLDILKANDGADAQALDDALMKECSFMFNHYTDIYNRVKKRELDMSILWEFLNVLEKIEQGESDQHAGAFEVGSLLKKMYIDSAVRQADARDAAHAKEQEQPRTPTHDISWNDFKAL